MEDERRLGLRLALAGSVLAGVVGVAAALTLGRDSGHRGHETNAQRAVNVAAVLRNALSINGPGTPDCNIWSAEFDNSGKTTKVNGGCGSGHFGSKTQVKILESGCIVVWDYNYRGLGVSEPACPPKTG